MNGINVKVTLYRFIALITREKDRLEIKDKDENRKVFLSMLTRHDQLTWLDMRTKHMSIDMRNKFMSTDMRT